MASNKVVVLIFIVVIIMFASVDNGQAIRASSVKDGKAGLSSVKDGKVISTNENENCTLDSYRCYKLCIKGCAYENHPAEGPCHDNCAYACDCNL
ncbi:hypothetical protein TanjilG_15209 [Lupinus angustifolius]|uniref:Knottin scorpion toxin-like domain-containing protein n=1 Tax=Lupinus angustifolius TaxID=3871 RepID=A0A1J7H5U7_LUPAN|nr:hypothetical protein TanjilG_15209 [Lupinus angustifolius]